MADGELTLQLDPDTSRLLKRLADAEGVTPEELVDRLLVEYAHDQIEWPADTIDPDPEIDARIARETRERGDGIPLEVVLAKLERWGKRGRGP